MYGLARELHFSHSVKARLTGTLVETKPKWGGENIKIERYLNSGKILAYFPLHEPDKLAKLHKVWMNWGTLPWSQPFYHIKEYFGEKVGIYFLFMGHYTRWLIGPGLIGLLLVYRVRIHRHTGASGQQSAERRHGGDDQLPGGQRRALPAFL